MTLKKTPRGRGNSPSPLLLPPVHFPLLPSLSPFLFSTLPSAHLSPPSTLLICLSISYSYNLSSSQSPPFLARPSLFAHPFLQFPSFAPALARSPFPPPPSSSLYLSPLLHLLRLPCSLPWPAVHSILPTLFPLPPRFPLVFLPFLHFTSPFPYRPQISLLLSPPSLLIPIFLSPLIPRCLIILVSFPSPLFIHLSQTPLLRYPLPPPSCIPPLGCDQTIRIPVSSNSFYLSPLPPPRTPTHPLHLARSLPPPSPKTPAPNNLTPPRPYLSPPTLCLPAYLLLPSPYFLNHSPTSSLPPRPPLPPLLFLPPLAHPITSLPSTCPASYQLRFIPSTILPSPSASTLTIFLKVSVVHVLCCLCLSLYSFHASPLPLPLDPLSPSHPFPLFSLYFTPSPKDVWLKALLARVPVSFYISTDIDCRSSKPFSQRYLCQFPVMGVKVFSRPSAR